MNKPILTDEEKAAIKAGTFSINAHFKRLDNENRMKDSVAAAAYQAQLTAEMAHEEDC